MAKTFPQGSDFVIPGHLDGPTLDKHGLCEADYIELSRLRKEEAWVIGLVVSVLGALISGVCLATFPTFGVSVWWVGAWVWVVVVLHLASESSDFVLRLLRRRRFDRRIEIEALIRGFECAFKEYFERILDRIYNNSLYRRRSTSSGFEEALASFQELLLNLRLPSKLLKYESIKNLDYYDSYASGRQFSGYRARTLGSSTSNTLAATAGTGSGQRSTSNISKPTIKPPPKPKPICPEKKFSSAAKLDWETLLKARMQIGITGEQLVVLIEKEYLEKIDRQDLADRVRHVSQDVGDGIGHDIQSFFADGRPKFIEVKSTTKSIENPFYMSRTEVEFLESHQDDSFVYRLLLDTDRETNADLRVYTARDVLEAELAATTYKVTIRN